MDELAWTEEELRSRAAKILVRPEYKRMDNQRLRKEYEEMWRAESGMFGHNATKARQEAGAELISRGHTTLPNPFGPIRIRIGGKWDSF
jgi:hypothetical protein